MIITLTGSNNFLLLRRLNQLMDDFSTHNGELAIERIDASDLETQPIIDAVSSLPFLSNSKMVVVRGLGSNKGASEEIEQIISSTEPSTELIIYEPTPDRRTSYYKTLSAKTKLEEFKELDGRQLTDWLISESSKLGGNISARDATYLVERIGLNQAILYSELEKLILYNSDITRQTIELLTEKTPQSKIFDLLDAAFAGNKARALEFYEDQRKQKVEPQNILALIIWQLHLLALAMYAKDKSATQIAQETKLNPYPLTKAQNLAKKISDRQLRAIIDEAADIDYESKVSEVDIDEALKNFVVTL